jgi:hypothetical protein
MKAFPIKGWNGYEQTIHEGMDLRDYFAAKAMQAMLSLDNVNDSYVSKEAYMMADAMMKAREIK